MNKEKLRADFQKEADKYLLGEDYSIESLEKVSRKYYAIIRLSQSVKNEETSDIDKETIAEINEAGLDGWYVGKNQKVVDSYHEILGENGYSEDSIEAIVLTTSNSQIYARFMRLNDGSIRAASVLIRTEDYT